MPKDLDPKAIERNIAYVLQENDLTALLREVEKLCEKFTGKGDLLLEARLSGVRETLKLFLDKPSCVADWVARGCTMTGYDWHA